MSDRPPTPRAPRAPRAPRVPSDPDTTGNASTGGNGGNGGGTTPPPPAPAAAARPRATRTPALEAKLQQFFAMPALAFSAAGDQYCAELWNARSPMLASSWYELSKTNAGVRKVLEQLVEGSAWGGVVMSTLAISLPIAKHHGLYRGPDPFAALLPGPPAPPPASRPGARGPGGAKSMQWTKAPDGPEATPTAAPMVRDDDDTATPPAPIYLEGAPPGVVTVAASAAAHNGAR